ncbi:MAG: hypothetical protein PHH37_09180 [Paludibacter sp.]|nr:hypothetical protein [Paludibacter sp.]
MKNLKLFFVVSLIFSTINAYSKELTDYALVNSIIVSQTNLQTIKGWGVTVNALTNSTAKQAELIDLGITIARIYMDHTESNADGTVVTSAMDGICNQIDIVNRYNLSYILSSWCPNYSMKDNNVMSGAGKLRTDKEGVFTDYWVNVCAYIQSKGLPLPTAISIQNEPTNGTSTYDGMGFQGQDTYNYTQYYRVIKSLRSKLDITGYTSVYLLGPEEGSYCTGKTWGNALAFLGGVGFPAFNDATLKNAIWGCSAHSYNWGGEITDIASWRDGCEKWGKDKWMTEFSDVETVNKSAPTYTFAIESTRRFCSDMAFVRNNYWLWWSASQGTYPEVLLDGTYYWKLPIYYILQKIWKNVPVGSFARKVTSTNSGLVTTDAINMDAVAFVTPENKTVVVLVNFTAKSISQSVDGLTGNKADIYQSTSTQNMLLTDSPTISSGVISSVTLPALSVTVIVTNNVSEVESIFNKVKNQLSVSVYENELKIMTGSIAGNVIIYNAKGQDIKDLGYLNSNSYTIWDKKNNENNQLPSGIYFFKLKNQSGGCKIFLK